MKTPKRKYYFYESSINPENGDVIMDAVTPELYEARWKRKNRIKQLKHTIDKLTFENAVFKQIFIQNRAFLKDLVAICKTLNDKQ